jgi:hypothetical protein
MYIEDRDFNKEGDGDDGDKDKDEISEKDKTTADDRSAKGTNSEVEEASEDSFPASDPPAF